jgi:DNA polymerase-4
MQKPDGLVTIALSDLPQKLYGLQLIELPGIGKKMEARLARKGVTTVQQLCLFSEKEMRDLWNGVVGSRWYHWLKLRTCTKPRRAAVL